MGKKVLYFVEYTWLLILLILVSLYYLSQSNIISVFNSDVILLPSLFKDLLVNNNHYRDWFLSPAPHLFPDAFLFFFIVLLTKNIYFEFLIFKWIRIVLIYCIVKYLYRHFFTRKMAIAFSLLVTSLLVILSLREFLAYNTFLIPSAHESEFIIGLLLLTITINLVHNTKANGNFKVLCSIFVILIFACSASDLLFIVQFSIPLTLAFIILYVKKRIELKELVTLSSLCLIPTMLGNFLSNYMVPHQVLFNYLDNPSIKNISVKTIIFQLLELIKVFKSIFIHLPWYIFILFYSSIISIFLIGILKNVHKNNINQKTFFLSTFICSCIVTNILALLMLIHGVADRYLLPLYYFPCLLFFLPLSIFETKLILKKIFTAIFLITLLYCLIKITPAFFKQNLQPKFSYYPTEISCIDRVLPANAHGIAEYWDANVLSLLSKKNITVVPVSVFLEPTYWEINSTILAKPSNFVILSHINPIFDLIPNIVYATYGAPEKISQCGNKQILIYPEDSLRPIKKPLFMHSGDSYNWPAILLPSLISNSKKENKRIAQPNDLRTFISYGPYIILPEGKYHFYIHYKSDASPKTRIAFYDVYSNTIGEITKSFIYGSKGKLNDISGKFKVNKSQNNKDKFEIRVFFLGGATFELENITLVRS